MIYFLRANGLDMVKIGYTRDEDSFQTRLQALQTGVPWKLELLRIIEGEQALEGVLHRFFADRRHHGEWFTYSPDMMVVFFDGERAVLRRHLSGKSRAYLEGVIERLVDALDEWTPDPDSEAEPDDESEPDDEADADEYMEIKRGELASAMHNFFILDHEDAEPKEVPVDGWCPPDPPLICAWPTIRTVEQGR